MNHICIITNYHISYNPRVLKEADALAVAGYKITVVTVNNNDLQRKFDEELMQSRSWQLLTVNFRRTVKKEKGKWLYLSLKNKYYNLLCRLTRKYGIAERAANKAFDDLKKLAMTQKADMYLVHHSEVLGAGYACAKKYKAILGFDAEDFQPGITESASLAQPEQLITFIEKKYLPYCQYFTAASKGIGEAYVKNYSVRNPVVILNVFPSIQLPAGKILQPVKFYWYSQVIGLGRGLDLLLKASAQVGGDFELHFRGSFQSPQHRQVMQDLVIELNLENKVFFHAPILANELIEDANKYDVGLALESDISVNRNICVTNKIFSYLMSGLAIIGSDTYGQKDIFSYFPEAVQLIRMNNISDITMAMQFYIQNPDKLYHAKTAARQAAEKEFNWENESGKLLAGVKEVFKQVPDSTRLLTKITDKN